MELTNRRRWVGFVAVAALSYALCDLLHETAHAITTLLPLGVRAFSISTVAVSTSRADPVVAAAGCLANLAFGATMVLSISPRRAPGWRYFWWLFGSLNLFNATGYLLYSAALNSGDLAVTFGALAPPQFWRPVSAVVGLASYAAAVGVSLRTLRRLVSAGVIAPSAVEQSCMVPYWSGAILLILGAALNPASHWLVLTSGAAVGLGAMVGLTLLPPLMKRRPLPLQPEQQTLDLRWPWLLSGLVAALIFITIFGPGLSLGHRSTPRRAPRPRLHRASPRAQAAAVLLALPCPISNSPGNLRAMSEDDGRHVALDLGTLTGEGAQQRIETTEEAYPSRSFVWRDLPSHSFQEDPTYYERPVLKEPVWIWAVPVYFYVGGTAGAAAVLAAAAQALDGEELRGLVRACRWVAAVGGAAGTVLLIRDLGRPERFLNMLRVFRPTSPMSLGSWVLAAAASTTMGSALLADRKGFLGRLGDATAYAAALFGMPLSGYTAVLLGNTAVPVWQATRRSLPHLFIGTSASGLAALFGLLPVDLKPQEEKIVERFGIAGKVVDLTCMAVVEREAGRVEAVGRPLREGLSGALWNAAKALTAASLALSLLPGRARVKRVAGGLLGTAGALALRFAVFHAGKASARDPRATFHGQRRESGAAG